MSKIVELKPEEIDTVVGGIVADTLTASAGVPTHGTSVNMPPRPAPEASHPRPHKR